MPMHRAISTLSDFLGTSKINRGNFYTAKAGLENLQPSNTPRVPASPPPSRSTRRGRRCPTRLRRGSRRGCQPNRAPDLRMSTAVANGLRRQLRQARAARYKRSECTLCAPAAPPFPAHVRGGGPHARPTNSARKEDSGHHLGALSQPVAAASTHG